MFTMEILTLTQDGQILFAITHRITAGSILAVPDSTPVQVNSKMGQ